MKNKIIIFGLMILILLTCSVSVFADDSLDNATLTVEDSEIEAIPLDEEKIETPSSEITITEDNYDDYFNKYTGKLKDDVDPSINTIKISNVSNKAFTIDRPLNIMPSSPDCEISNGVIHLIAGSSGSNITNLIINNTKGELYQDGLFVSKLHGIWFTNSSDNYVFNNTICIPGAEGCYAMPMGHSSRNQILYNDIVSTFTSCILMGLCDYNNISYNKIEIKRQQGMVTANAIYANPYGHADYSGPADCIGTYISNNYIKNSGQNTDWEYTINIFGQSDYTQIINNTILHGGAGISASNKNVTISGNTIVNCSISIFTNSNENLVISNNKITGSSMNSAIFLLPGTHPETTFIMGNEITFDNLYCAIDVNGANVFNNTIRLSNYGIGIATNNSNVHNNYIHVVADAGISITGSNSNVSDNTVHTKGNGIIASILDSKFKIYNTVISNNKIYSDKYGVYIEGYVYNTTIMDNYIETNESDAFHIDMYMTLDDNNPGKIEDNTVNGIIKDTEILIINDNNFYDYFDDEGYLKYNFKTNSKRILFLTFLTDKNLYFDDSITLTSNKQANLLYNVTITLEGDASDSIIKDLKFYSFNKESIVLNCVDNVLIKDNEFTTLTDNVFESKTISITGKCNFCNITDNNIFINSKADYTYAILVSEPSYVFNKKFSKNFLISNNNIIIKSTGMAEGMYFDALVESNITDNNINIVSDGSAYGISVCDVSGRPYDINIDSNKIIVNSKEMSYLIELYRADNCEIINNYLKGTSNGVYGIGIYNSNSIINGNEIIVLGKNLTDLPPEDALGKGNSAVYIARQSQVNEFKNNIIDSQNCEIITNSNSNINKIANSFVIANYNYDSYFNNKCQMYGNIIKDGDIILFKNFTDSKTMNINVSVLIKPYSHFNEFKATLILSNGLGESVISGFIFNNANIKLNEVHDVLISSNTFIDSKINDENGVNNNISNNSFTAKTNNVQVITFNNCLNETFEFNIINITSSNSNFIVIEKSNGTMITNNSFDSSGMSIKLINSKSSNSTHIIDNNVNINASGDIYAYIGDNAISDKILSNSIIINALTGTPIAIYYKNSKDNEIKFNRIISYSKKGQDYTIVIDSDDNTVTNNYLISSNGFKKGNDAVDAVNSIVHDNIPAEVYVSLNGSENGNGSFDNPYSSIKKAIEKSPSGVVIHILPGMYNESDIIIDKNITLTAINLEGNTYINALGNQLFKINKSGILTVNALKIFNGFSVEGGSLFDNLGTLVINNSIIYNSSSYYNNSNPEFKYKNKYDKNRYSHDCSNLGVGGAILNHGELIINSSILYNNFAHKGGAIADFGKTTIKNSLIFNNVGVHGGAIYTDSDKEFFIENSEFRDNLAIQTLDYCYIKQIIYEKYPNLAGLRYRYSSNCEVLSGIGGAIFSNTVLTIDNSLFNHNTAKYGGAISYDSDLLTEYYSNRDLDYSGNGGKLLKYSVTSILKIKNSIFINNEAKNTSCGNLSMLVDDPYGGSVYNIHAEGGAIFGALREFVLYNSTFEHNLAENDGGALCVQSLNSTIESCKFNENVAGKHGGGLDIFGNFEIFNTEITNNSAKYGGAMQYNSYSIYERTQNNIDMFNVTVTGNNALEYGGAFQIGLANFAIKNSNIYDNNAPIGSTFAGIRGISSNGNIDARGNWWGSVDGPDDSVLSQPNIRFRTWAGEKIDWTPVNINNAGISNNNGIRPNSQSQTSSGASTGSAVHTGSTLRIDSTNSYNPSSHGGSSDGFNFNGNWPNGNNEGNNGGFNFNDGTNPYNPNGESKTNVRGDVVNPNSLSKTNSSTVNNLASVGMTANAADSSAGGETSSSEGTSEESVNAYEITKEVKKEINENDFSIFNILFILLWIFLFMGFYRKYKTMDDS